MASVKIMNSRQIKPILKFLKERWGFDEKLELVFLTNSKGRISVIHRDMEKVIENVKRIDTIGMYFGELREHDFRLSIEGSQLVGPKASKNVVEVTDAQIEDWIKGNDILVEHDEKGFVIISHRGDFVGCGFFKNGNVQNFIPKNRRVHELNTDSMSGEDSE